MTSSDRALLTDAARASVKIMRDLWDTSEAESRQALETAGVKMNAVEPDAFRRAAEPLVRELLRDPQLRRLHDAIRAAA